MSRKREEKSSVADRWACGKQEVRAVGSIDQGGILLKEPVVY